MATTDDTMCFEATCKHNRKPKKANKALDCSQCTTCWTWYHDDCVNVKKDELLGTWPCPPCRLMPSNVKKMNDTVTQVLSMVTGLSSTVVEMKSICESSSHQLHQLKKEYEEIRSENENLRKQIEEMKKMIKDKENEVFTEGNCSHLVIGDSLLKSIDENKLDNTYVKSLQGADISDVMHRLNDTDDIFMDITVCVGTNDCSNGDEFVPAALTDTYKQLVNTAAKKVRDISKVKVVSIPPRIDDPKKQDRVKSLNACLCTVANETGATFIDNDPAFLLQDGSPNDGYLLTDGVHLSTTGTNRLVKNMRLPVKEKFRRNVCKDLNNGNKPTGDWTVVQRKHRNPLRHAGNRNFQQMNDNQGTSGRKCWNCGEPNHVAMNCRHGQPVRCNSCYTLGHKSKFCSGH